MHKVLLSSEFTKYKKHEYKKRDFSKSINAQEVLDIQNNFLRNFKRVNSERLRVTRIHADLSEGNVLVSKGELKAFIDFDDSDYDYIAYELAIFIAHSFVRSDVIYWNKIKLFLSEYNRYVKLNPEEVRAIYYLIKYRLLGILYWHFEYIDKYPKKKVTLNKGIKRSYDRLANFEKVGFEEFMEKIK